MTRSPATCTLPEILRNGSDAGLRTFLYDLFSVARMLDHIRETMGARLGISGFQFHLLMAIHDLDGQPAGDSAPGVKQLARHLRAAPPNVTVEVAKLVRAGLLEKRRDAQDGRAVNIRLTAKGAAAVESALPFVRDINDRMFGALDRATFDGARTALGLIRDAGEEVVGALRDDAYQTA